MKKLLLVITLLLLSFSGCSHKEIVIEKELVCTKQQTFTKPTAKLRVYNEDIETAKAYVEANNEGYSFYEEQVRRNNELCISKSRESNIKDKTENGEE